MISILDYGSGNLQAITTLVKRSNVDFEVVSHPEQLAQASKIILPGVGAFDRTASEFTNCGLADAMKARMATGDAMCLGICIGMHLLSSGSEEGELPGLGLVPGNVVHFDAQRISDKPKIPHMGWNTVATEEPHPLLQSIDWDLGFYFTHSYHYQCQDEADVIGRTHHGYPFHSVVGRDGAFGVQFHPEKSHSNGVQLIHNFIGL